MTANAKPLSRRALGVAGRILLIVLGVFLLALLVLTVFGYYQVRLAWPQTQGTLQIPGLQDSVTVIRDKRGIPQIYASNSHQYLRQN